jgi:type VI protein secretion system component VasF
MFRRVFNALLFLCLVAAPVWAQQPPNAGLEGFVPAQSLPPTESIPAAPLLLSAYAFFLVLMMFYLWTIWRRISKVEQDMQNLERRQGALKR